MTINGYKAESIVKRIHKLQKNLFKKCKDLGGIHIEKTHFGDYIGDFSIYYFLDYVQLHLKPGLATDYIFWEFKDYNSCGTDYGLDPDKYEGSFDMKLMKEFDLDKVALEFLKEELEKEERDKDYSEYEQKERLSKIEGINKAIEKLCPEKKVNSEK